MPSGLDARARYNFCSRCSQIYVQGPRSRRYWLSSGELRNSVSAGMSGLPASCSMVESAPCSHLDRASGFLPEWATGSTGGTIGGQQELRVRSKMESRVQSLVKSSASCSAGTLQWRSVHGRQLSRMNSHCGHQLSNWRARQCCVGSEVCQPSCLHASLHEWPACITADGQRASRDVISGKGQNQAKGFSGPRRSSARTTMR